MLWRRHIYCCKVVYSCWLFYYTLERDAKGPLPYLLSSFCRLLSNKKEKKKSAKSKKHCSAYQLECVSQWDNPSGYQVALFGRPPRAEICQRHSRPLFFLFQLGRLLFFFIFSFFTCLFSIQCCHQKTRSRHSLCTQKPRHATEVEG